MAVLSRHWFHDALEKDAGTRVGRWVNAALMLLIALNIIAVLLESEENLHQHYAEAFHAFEVFSVFIFTLEYLVRVWVCVEDKNARYQHPFLGRLRYLVSPAALVDLVAILPFYIGMFAAADDLLVLRSLRLLRVFKLTRYSHSIDLLINVLKQQAETMLSALLMLIVLILLAATGIYLVEGEAQPEAFGSIPRSLWWSTVTLTTVGYGDVVPHTLPGKVFSGLITITGIAVAALPAGILASGLIDELERRRDQFRTEILHAMEDGKISFTELRHLERLRDKIGVSHADARLIFREIKQATRLQTHLNCPHCENPLIIGHPAGHIHVTTAQRRKKESPL